MTTQMNYLKELETASLCINIVLRGTNIYTRRPTDSAIKWLHDTGLIVSPFFGDDRFFKVTKGWISVNDYKKLISVERITKNKF